MRPDMHPETPLDLEQRLARSLRRNAAPVYARTALAQGAFRQARTIRLRRRITTAVASLAVLAAGVPLGVDLLGDGGPITARFQPAGTTPSVNPAETKSQAPEEPAAPARSTVTIDDLSALPQGEPPEVSWYENGVIHQLSQGGEQPNLEIPVGGLPDGAVVSYLPAAGGWLVADECCGETPNGARVRLIGDDGEPIRTLPTTILPAVSADGDRLAWLEDGGSDTSDGHDLDLVLADLEGTELARQPLPGADDPAGSDLKYPVGFLGDLVVVGRSTQGEGSGRAAADLWDPETGTISKLAAWGSEETEHIVRATDGTGLFVSTRYHPQESTLVPCQGVFDLGQDGRELWSTCDGLQIHALSSEEGLLGQEGRLAFGTRSSGAATSYLVLNAETGERLLEVRGLDRARPAMFAEYESGVLIDASLNGQSAVIRCSLDGRCELATDIYPETEPDTSTSVTLPGHH